MFTVCLDVELVSIKWVLDRRGELRGREKVRKRREVKEEEGTYQIVAICDILDDTLCNFFSHLRVEELLQLQAKCARVNIGSERLKGFLYDLWFKA